MNEKKPISNTSPVWQDAMSRFYDEPLRYVFEELERQYDVTVKTPTLNRSFSGSFRHQDLENALRSICKPLGLKFVISDDGKTVEIE